MDVVENNPAEIAEGDLRHPETQQAFRMVKFFIGTYLSFSLAALALVVALQNHHSVVNAAVWIRVSIVAASALVLFLSTFSAARGSRGSYRRLRILSTVMLAAVAVIISLPGTFPLWMKIEQGICGMVLLCALLALNRKHLRSVFG